MQQLQRLREGQDAVVGRHLVKGSLQSAFGARAVVAANVDDERVVELALILNFRQTVRIDAKRKANVEDLGLEAAEIRVRDGGVEADASLRTSNPAVYAAGDVAFPEKYTHAAMATARLCVANAMDGAGRPARDLVIPHCTYTDPEVATVGLTPVRAAEEGVALDTHRLELSKVERAFIDGEEEGFAALYTRKGTGEIVGATLVAAHAGEMISELTLAITNKLPMKALAETVHCYPTQAEVFQRIALTYGK
jgi:pyruvate/2-oxoglutarate dehydrogenase complex dihydrolipoamide dehydrogenase (E3) component